MNCGEGHTTYKPEGVAMRAYELYNKRKERLQPALDTVMTLMTIDLRCEGDMHAEIMVAATIMKLMPVHVSMRMVMMRRLC